MKPFIVCLLAVPVIVHIAAVAHSQASIPPGTRVERDLVFATLGKQDLALDLYRPQTQTGTVPVVVWIYGGAWMGRAKAQQASVASWLASHGYAVAIIDYRLSSEALFPAQIKDCKAAVQWLRANAEKYKLDTAHFGAWGLSSGGHLASLLGVTGGVATLEGEGGKADQSSRVQAVVDFFGPTDLLQMDAHMLPGNRFKHDDADSPESRLVGGPIQQYADKVRQANPITFVTDDDPPFLIMHGEQDALVPLHQSELLYDALKKARCDVTFYKIAGAGHGTPEFRSEMIRSAVLAFFDKHLKLKPTPNR